MERSNKGNGGFFREQWEKNMLDGKNDDVIDASMTFSSSFL